jgi:hypothetical protein
MRLLGPVFGLLVSTITHAFPACSGAVGFGLRSCTRTPGRGMLGAAGGLVVGAECFRKCCAAAKAATLRSVSAVKRVGGDRHARGQNAEVPAAGQAAFRAWDKQGSLHFALRG